MHSEQANEGISDSCRNIGLHVMVCNKTTVVDIELQLLLKCGLLVLRPLELNKHRAKKYERKYKTY